MNRVSFIESVDCIKYPEMIVTFFDHFVALKQIVEDTGKVTVINQGENKIEFAIEFNSKEALDSALALIYSLNSVITIYGRLIMINTEVLTDSKLKIELC